MHKIKRTSQFKRDYDREAEFKLVDEAGPGTAVTLLLLQLFFPSCKGNRERVSNLPFKFISFFQLDRRIYIPFPID